MEHTIKFLREIRTWFFADGNKAYKVEQVEGSDAANMFVNSPDQEGFDLVYSNNDWPIKSNLAAADFIQSYFDISIYKDLQSLNP